MEFFKRRTLVLLIASSLAMTACQGDKGAPGDAGASGATGSTGPTGSKGNPGIASGVIQGTLTYSPDGVKVYQATGVQVSTLPDAGVTATTDANGSYSLVVPVGIYSVLFRGTGFAPAQVDGVAVNGSRVAAASKALVATTPFTVAAAALPLPAGFGKQVQLDVVVSAGGQPVGDLSGYSFHWDVVSGPTAAAPSQADVKSPNITTSTLAQVAASGSLVGFSVPTRASLVGVTYQQMLDMTYQYKCTVTDPNGFKASVVVGVKPALWTAGTSNMAPIGVPLIAASNVADTGAWTFTAPAGSTAALDDVNASNPTFTPDVVGSYVLTRGTATKITVNAGTYFGSNPQCGPCHVQTVQNLVNPKWAAYQTSKHGTVDVTSAGLDGAEGPYFSSECLTCHTTGYNPYAVNGGFDDMAAEAGWTFPTKLAAGNSAAMPAIMQRMNKVQCESCHGPMGAHEELVTGPNDVKPQGEYSANVCGACHDELPYADRYRLWAQSGHNTTATISHTGSSCGRCHTAQGFVQYVKQQQGLLPDPVNAGKFLPANPGVITNPDGTVATAAFLTSIGLTPAAAQPQVCQSCHDPHGTTLRVQDTTGVTTSGFSYQGAGAGAVCMVCHSNRTGARGDAVVNDTFTGLALTAIGSPHDGRQSDVFAGKNAYFVSGYFVSKHAAVADTCVGCHVKLAPDSVKAMGTNHTFKADGTICKNCHSSAISLESLENEFIALKADAVNAIATGLSNAIGASAWTVTAYDLNGLKASVASVAPTATPTAAALVTGWRYNNGLTPTRTTTYLVLTFATAQTDPINGGTTTTLAVKSDLSEVKIAGAAAVQPLGVFNKANWNLAIVSSTATDDQGNPTPAANYVHNPSFVRAVLGATKAQLLSATASGGSNPL